MHYLTLKRKKWGRVTVQCIPERAAHASSIPRATLFHPFSGFWSTRHYLPHQFFSVLWVWVSVPRYSLPPGVYVPTSLAPLVSWLMKHLGLVHYSPTETLYFPIPKYFHGNVLATRASILRATRIYSTDNDPSCTHQPLNVQSSLGSPEKGSCIQQSHLILLQIFLFPF